MHLIWKYAMCIVARLDYCDTYLVLSTNVNRKSLETEFSIAICRPTGDKWQPKTLFLANFDPRSSICKSVFECRLPVCYCNLGNMQCVLLLDCGMIVTPRFLITAYSKIKPSHPIQIDNFEYKNEFKYKLKLRFCHSLINDISQK